MKNIYLTLLFLTSSLAISSQTLTNYLTGLDNPKGLGFDSNGVLYVAEHNTSKIFKVTAKETSTLFKNTGWKNNHIAFDNNDNLYTTNNFMGEILKIDINGNQEVFLNSSNNIGSPYGVRFDKDGNLICNATSGKLSKYSPTKVETVIASGISSAKGFDLDSNGNIYLASSNQGKLLKIDTDGNVTTLLDGIFELSAVVVDKNDDVYFNHRQGFNTRKIRRYNVNDGTTTDIITNGISSTVGDMIFDSSGNLYLTHDDKISIVENLVLSQEEFSFKKEVTIFPNPVKDEILISDEIDSFQIFDVTGKEVQNGNSRKIYVNNLNSGLYFLKLKNNEGHLFSKKFVKK